MNNIDLLEESLLQAVDAMAEESDDRVSKILADLFKSAVLEKYKDAYHQELSQGKVHRKNVEKAIDFYFANMSAKLQVQVIRAKPDPNSKNCDVDKEWLKENILVHEGN